VAAIFSEELPSRRSGPHHHHHPASPERRKETPKQTIKRKKYV
jgi:hypothetical protein